jgi:putative spermidine/putrescine transport system ATP-binding protein
MTQIAIRKTEAMGESIGELGARVIFDQIEKRYGSVIAVDGVSLDIAPGEFVTLLGPSGSGKTTTLMMLAGFEIPTAGEIYVDEDPIAAVPPYRRNIGMVFQNYALFPHMTVGENIAFPLQMRKMSRAEITRQTTAVLALVGLPGYEGRYPRQLSGGQQQRVAVARALVTEPSVLLADEPTGDLDERTAEALHVLLREMHRERQLSSVIATHNMQLAKSCDRVLRLEGGQLVPG